MEQINRTKRQTMVDKILDNKLKMDQQDPLATGTELR
jgi:hypothetical protein